MLNEKDITINSENTEQTIKEINMNNSEISLDKEKHKSSKSLAQLGMNQLIIKNDKFTEEVKNLKSLIVSLNNKVNEQIITINNNKLNYDKDSKIIKEKLEKEIKQYKKNFIVPQQRQNQSKIHTKL